MDFVFIILHYMSYEDTCNCVTSVLETQEGNYHIFVVDNGSENGTGQQLKDRFSKESKVEVLLSGDNLGFARGNNVGYRRALEYQPQFIICMNNDTIMLQKDFLGRIEKVYHETAFGVLGPDIIAGKEGEIHQNPAHYQALSYVQVKNLVRVKKMYLRKLTAQFPGAFLWGFLYGVMRRLYGMRYKENKEHSPDIILHGSCLIFSSLFIQKNQEEAFYSGTFLYLEEEFLHLKCHNQGLKIVYSPELSIRHLEDKSTEYVFKSNRKRETFKTREFIRSAEKLMLLLK